MSSKFTPGPWRPITNRTNNGNVVIGIEAGTKHWICKMVEDTEIGGFEREQANAQLIAKAPELRKLVQQMRNEIAFRDRTEFEEQWLEEAEALLARTR